MSNNHQDLDALPPQKLPDVSYLGDDVSYGYDQHDMQEHARAYGRQCYESAKHEALQGQLALVQLYNEAMASLAKAVEERDALRRAQEGREPVAWRVRRSDGEHELFFHEPTAKQRAECFVPHSSAEPLFTSPPPKSDEARDAERWRMADLINRESNLHPDSRKHQVALSAYRDAFKSGLDFCAAIDAALAAQQKGKK